MPTFASLTVADGLATPVNHTFAPLMKDGQMATFADRSPALATAWKKITHEVTNPKNAGAAIRVKIGINDPQVATVDGSLKVVRNSSCQVVFNFSQEATDQDKKDLVAYASNYLANATVKAGVIAAEPWF